MKLLSFVLLVCVMLPLAGISQEIKVHRSFGGMRFEYDTLTLTHRQVSEIISINPVATHQFRVARKCSVISGILGFSGVLLVAIPGVGAVLGSEPNWTLAAGGGALIVASIPFSIVYKRKASRAVEMYNAGLTGARLYFRGNAVGIAF